ncbi:MAG: Hsp20/alpha crystallin family protein [Bryobacterales bacterium]|nr:Hsp20/alpha crystallin family protein [Bryobacterales bacterium]
MTLLRHNPFNPWREFAAAIGGPQTTPRWVPSFDVQETDSAYVLRGDLPGMSQKDIEVRVDDGFLVVRGERAADEKADVGRIRHERPTGKFERAYRLPDDANDSAVTASYANGVLELEVPKQEPVDAARLIPVN